MPDVERIIGLKGLDGMDMLFPAIKSRYASAMKVDCHARFKQTGFVDITNSLPCVYDIEGQHFDHTGWLSPKQLHIRALKKFMDPTMDLSDQISCDVSSEPTAQKIYAANPTLARKIKKAFLAHLSGLEAIALEISTRGVTPTVKKRRPRL